VCAIASGNSKEEASGDRCTGKTLRLRRRSRDLEEGSSLDGKGRERTVFHETMPGGAQSCSLSLAKESRAGSGAAEVRSRGLTHGEKTSSIQ